MNNTADYLLNKYGPNPAPGAPQVIPGTIRQNLYQLFAELGFKVGCEVGVFRARNARSMFREIPELKLYGVEAYDDQPTSTRHKTVPRYDYNRQAMAGRMKDRNFILIEKFSEIAVQDIPYNSLDFVYIDADHSYDYVMTDIILWARRVRPGGIVSGHDYILPGEYHHKFDINVKEAVDDYTRLHKISPLYLTDKTVGINKSDKCPSWFFVKPMTKGLVYYTDNTPEDKISSACQKQLNRCMKKWKYPIYSISQKPINFGINTVMDLESSVLSMYKQILKGLQECQTDIIFLVERDVLYHPSHFDFTPEKEDHFYYNLNLWNVSSVDGKAIYYIHNDVSMVCAYRSLLLRHYQKAVEWAEKTGYKYSWGFSPPKGLPKEDRYGHYAYYKSATADVNIRHPNAFTKQRMTKDQFRSERSYKGWTESDGVPGWGKTLGRFDEFISEYL